MTSVPPPPSPPPPPPGPPPGGPWAAGPDPLGPWRIRPPGRTPGRALAVAVVVVTAAGFALLAVAVAAAVILSPGETTDGRAGERSGRVDPPAEWDPAIEPVAAAVAELRGLAWEHPVPVRFLEDDEFVAEVTSDDADLTDEDLESIEQAQAVFQALSLLPSGVDLLDALDDARAAGVLAFYDPEAGEIVMRGSDLTPSVEITLAHELTHALQDQHFGLSDLQDQASDLGTSGALIAVIEGDATLVEHEYALRELSPEELDEAERDETLDGLAESHPEQILGGDDIPEIVMVMLGYPYALGPGFVSAVMAADPVDPAQARDLLFQPTLTEADVLAPVRYLAGDDPEDVPVPELPDGATLLDEPEPFGAVGWYLVLAAHLDAADSLRAVDGWAGDSSVVYERDDRPCIAAAFRGETSAATAAMERALEDWAAAGDVEGATVDRVGSDVVLEACGGHDATGPTRSMEDALVLAAIRNIVFAELIVELSVDVAWCTTNELVFDTEVFGLLEQVELTAEDEELLTSRAFDAGMACAAA